jgi:uncharacterized membrane protein YbhN (UPF0104 family)
MSTPQEAPPAPKPGRLRRASRWGGALLGVALLVVLVRSTTIRDLSTVFSRGRVDLLVVAVLAGLLATQFRVSRYTAFFPAPGRWLDLYGTFAMLRAVNYVLPFRSGEVVALFLLKKRRLAPGVSEALPAWVLLRIGDLLALFLLVTAVSLTVRLHEDRAAWLTTAFLLLSVVAFGGMLALVVLGRRLRPSTGDAEPEGWIARRWTSIRLGLGHLRSRRRLLRVIVASLLVWIANLGTAALALWAFSPPLSFVACAFACGLAISLNLLPIRAPLGLGTGDAMWAGSLALMGVEAGEAVALALGLRVVQLLVTGIDGLLGLLLSTRAVPPLEARTDPEAP